MYRIYLLVYFVFLTCRISAQHTASSIIQKSIDYHDKEHKWQSLAATMKFEESRPDGSTKNTLFVFDNQKGYFLVDRGKESIYEIQNNKCLSYSEESSCEQGIKMRNYYLYLWGLPMKLNDEGTIPDTNVKEKVVDGIEAYVIKVDYEKDVWYFYFAKDNYRLLSYKFYFDKEETNGEWIKLHDQVKHNDLIIPKERSWYKLPENKFLGKDNLIDFEIKQSD